MIHRILTDHMSELQAYQQEILKKMRPHIHKIVKDINNIKVTIYLDLLSFEIQEGNGDNELVIQFNTNGDMEFEWTKKTFGQWLYDVITDIATEITETVIAAIKAVIKLTQNMVGMERREAITWKNTSN